MNKEKFLALGLSTELAELCEKEVSKELENYVLKESYDSDICDRDNKIKELESSYKKELETVKIDKAVDLAISKARGKNIKAIKSLVDFENIVLEDNGNIFGIEKEIERLTNDEETKFLFDVGEQIVLKGITPSVSNNIGTISKDDFGKMNYNERVELLNSNRELYNELSM